jgi:hypothetical protein
VIVTSSKKLSRPLICHCGSSMPRKLATVYACLQYLVRLHEATDQRVGGAARRQSVYT